MTLQLTFRTHARIHLVSLELHHIMLTALLALCAISAWAYAFLRLQTRQAEATERLAAHAAGIEDKLHALRITLEQPR